MKQTSLIVAMVVVALVGFTGGSINTSAPLGTVPGAGSWFSFSQADASPYRRSVRRTARRTSRRTAARHSYY